MTGWPSDRDRSHQDHAVDVVAGGMYDDSVGYFVRPTVLQVDDPDHEHLREGYFGPFLSVHVYADSEYDAMLRQIESVAPYALTGAVIAQDRTLIARTTKELSRCWTD